MLLTSVPYVGIQSSQKASNAMSLGPSSGQDSQSLLMLTPGSSVQPSQSLFMSIAKSSVELSASPSVSLPTSVPYVGVQSSQDSSGQDSQSRLILTPSSNVQPSQSLLMSVIESNVELSQTPSVSLSKSVPEVAFQSSQTASKSMSSGLVALVTTSISNLEPTLSQTMAMQQPSDSPVNISPSPSRLSTDISTSTVIASAEKNAVYAAEIVIEQEFTDDLNDQTTVAFVELASRVVAYMTEVYSSFPGFMRVEVISFTNGSVVADTRVIFERNSSVTAQNITNSLQTANITGNNSLEIIGVNVIRIESVPSSSATSIVMANSSIQIVPSQSLSSPSSNINVPVSKSSIVYSSMISLRPNATLISSTPN